MKHIKVTILLLLIVFLATGSYAQNQNLQSNIDSLKSRVVVLEKKLTSREKELVELQKNLNLIHEKVNEAKEMAYKTDRELWKLGLNWISGSLSILFAIIGFFAAFFSTRKYIELKAKEQLDNHLKDPEWTKALNDKIQKRLAENKLKEEVKILVISNDDDSEKVIKNYFQENKFNEKKISYKRGTEVAFNNSDFDILFINNQNNLFGLPEKSATPTSAKISTKATQSTSKTDTSLSVNTKSSANIEVTTVLDALINDIKVSYASRNYAVFYFNDGGIILPKELDKGLNSSYANSLASLYHNLLDLMRYKYVVLDDKKLD